MIDPSIETELRAVLDNVPPVNHAFGYGSGVLPQPLRDDEGPSASARDHAATGSVVDFVFAVDDPRAWHRRPGKAQQLQEKRATQFAGAVSAAANRNSSTRTAWRMFVIVDES